MARLLRLLPIFASSHEPRSVDPSKIAFVSLAAMANQARPLRGVTPSRRSKVCRSGRSWFTNWALAHVRTSGRSNKPYATIISSRSVFPASMHPPKPNSVEPPLVSYRMPVWEGWRREASPYPDLGGKRPSAERREPAG